LIIPIDLNEQFSTKLKLFIYLANWAKRSAIAGKQYLSGFNSEDIIRPILHLNTISIPMIEK
jgi:hypothetical protein